MGSTGTGRFGDYKGNGSDISKCDTPLRQVRLEEVSTIEYYVRNQSIAPMSECQRISEPRADEFLSHCARELVSQ